MFETGKLAMNIDGEYRTAFIDSEHPNLKYATAPMPVDDSQPNLYGGGYTEYVARTGQEAPGLRS